MKVFPSRNPSGRREAELLARYLDSVEEAAGLHAARGGAAAARRKGAQADSGRALRALRAAGGAEGCEVEGCEAEGEGTAAEGGDDGDARDGAEQGRKGGVLELLQGAEGKGAGGEAGGAPHAAEVRRVAMCRVSMTSRPGWTLCPSLSPVTPAPTPPLEPTQMRRVMARYEVVFDELVRQVSTHCLERGHCLARVWSQLSSACAAFAAHEAAQRRQLQRLQAQLHSATEQLAKQGEAKAGLIVQKAVLEGRLQWGTALSRVTRYKDTVRWRTPLELRLSLTLGLTLGLGLGLSLGLGLGLSLTH